MLLNILLPFANSVFSLGLKNGITISVGSGLLFYVFVGYLLDRYEIRKEFRVLLYIFGIAGLLIHIIGTQILSIKAGEIVSVYKGYTNLPCVLYSAAVFVFLKDLGSVLTRTKIISKMISFFRSFTYPLYLIHWFVMVVLSSFFDINIRSIFWRLFGFMPIGTVCIVITIIVRKIPFLKRVLP